jgi:hypothetical protein
MLILPAKEQASLHKEARVEMENHFNKLLEDLLNKHQNVDLYWILGKSKTEAIGTKTVVRPFLEACMEKPPVVKESFVYEVDNKRGVKTLLWVVYPNGTMRFPTLNKSISVAS